MKRTTAIVSIIFFVALFIFTFLFGIKDVLLPFEQLGNRTRLVSYPIYIAILFCLPFSVFMIAISIYCLVTKRRSQSKVVWIIYIIGIVSLLGFFPRYHLGTRVDDAGYVKCVKESRTSTKSSWRVYAKSIDLCKESSGIAGG